jgi:hypothetical protein
LRHAEAFTYENGRLVFRWNAQKGYIWQNAKKSKRDRIIFLPPDAPAYVEECIAKYPRGRSSALCGVTRGGRRS